MGKLHKPLALLSVLMVVLSSSLVTTPVNAKTLQDWWDQGWKYGCRITLNETVGMDRINEPVDVFVDKILPGYCTNAENETRIIDPDNNEVPCQVYNVTMGDGYVKSFNVVFLANCSSYSTTHYHVMYNKTAAQAPVYYDGFLPPEYLEWPTDYPIWFVKANKSGTVYMYLEEDWWNLIYLYSNDTKITPTPGATAWAHGNIGTLWKDAWGKEWYGVNKSIAVVNSGPVFVDFNYTEAGASDLVVYQYNVTMTNMLRVYYQPDLNTLLRYHITYKITTNLPNYTISSIQYMNWGFGNSTKESIYKHITWKNITGAINTQLVETIVFDDIWSPASPVGWWSYNGTSTLPEQTDTPAANVGFILTYSRGIIAGPPTPDYTVKFEHSNQSGIYGGGHQNYEKLEGTYNGLLGEVIEMTGYIVVTTPVDENIAPTMEEKAKKLRNPLEYTVGPQFEIPEFPFTGAIMILVLLTVLTGLRKLPIVKRLRLKDFERTLYEQ